jgi:ADP-ribose pyrophosphatase YjhB (NUDIX family)
LQAAIWNTAVVKTMRGIGWIVRGCWDDTAMDQTWDARAFAPDDPAAVATAWAEAQRAKPGLYDGPMVRLDGCRPGGRLRLCLRPTSYRAFWGTQVAITGLPRPHRADPLGCSTLVVTADGWLVLGRRSARVALYPGRVHPFGGCIEPGAAVTAEARRELREETGVDDRDIRRLAVVGIVVDRRLAQPELLTVAWLRLSRDRLVAGIDPEEHAGWWSVRADAGAGPTSVRDPTLTPVARALIAAWWTARDLPSGTSWPGSLASEYH